MSKKKNTSRESTSKSMSFRIHMIKNIRFRYSSISDKVKEIDPNNLGLIVNWTSRADGNAKTIGLILKTGYAYTLDKKREIIVEYVNETVFSIQNFDEVVKIINPGSFELDNTFMKNLLSISLSTTRGILFEKLNNSEYQNLIFPAMGHDDIDKIHKEALLKKEPQTGSDDVVE